MQRPLWWTYRHLRIDQFTAAVHAIVDAEVDQAGDRAAADADDRGLTGRARAAHVAHATAATEDQLRRQATAAIEHYVGARQADIEAQRLRHIDAHGCHQACRLIRSRL